MSKKGFSYKQAISELEDIIYKLENEEIDLDNLTDNLKKASELILDCKNNLKQSEEEIEKIIKTIQPQKSS